MAPREELDLPDQRDHLVMVGFLGEMVKMEPREREDSREKKEKLADTGHV